MRTTRTLLILGVCTLILAGCSGSDKGKDKKNGWSQSDAREHKKDGARDDRNMLKKMNEMGIAPEDAGARVDGDMDGPGRPKGAASGPPKADSSGGTGSGLGTTDRPREAMAEEAMAGGKHETPLQPTEPPQPDPQSGQLTAGSFDDNLTPRFYEKFVRSLQQNRKLSDLPQRFLGQRLLIAVRNGENKPVGNCRIHLAPAAAGNGVELIARSNGTAVFLTTWDGIDATGDFVVTVTPPDGAAPVKETVRRGVDRWEIKLPSAISVPPLNLDLCICLDTTGSMSKELRFLISEVKSIALAIKDKFPNVQTNFGLVVYKDRDDVYVAKHFPFTPDVEEFRRNLGAERADGGGDIPEAVQEGFREANKMQWRDKDTVRVMFHIADAPPHDQDIEETLKLADQLRKKGVVIYPVACKGYDDPCEFVMRSSALLSGGQFLFLTDDSGIGGKHDEPHIPYYKVQRLEHLMIRMIASELSGRRIEPEPKQVMRVVGRPVN
jgi:hypothetical protein